MRSPRAQAFLKTALVSAVVTILLGMAHNFHPAPWLGGSILASAAITIILAIGAYVLERRTP